MSWTLVAMLIKNRAISIHCYLFDCWTGGRRLCLCGCFRCAPRFGFPPALPLCVEVRCCRGSLPLGIFTGSTLLQAHTTAVRHCDILHGKNAVTLVVTAMSRFELLCQDLEQLRWPALAC